MMKKITDHQMLRAARSLLTEHLSMRPATQAEAQALADRYEAEARSEEEAAAHLRALRPRTAAERGRGPHSVAMQHADGIDQCRALQAACRCESAAARARWHRDAWQRVADGPTGDAWRKTLAEYQGRVDYYQGMITARTGASRD